MKIIRATRYRSRCLIRIHYKAIMTARVNTPIGVLVKDFYSEEEVTAFFGNMPEEIAAAERFFNAGTRWQRWVHSHGDPTPRVTHYLLPKVDKASGRIYRFTFGNRKDGS